MDNPLNSELTVKIETALRNNNQALAISIVKEYLKGKVIPLNIAITGESGTGKSTFVNAIRGIDNGDEGAAPTGSIESSKEALPYFHPNDPNIILWDCPGIGTTKYPAYMYLELIDFKKFDFFIIISDTHFRENDVKLAREIKKMGKKFYFVRSKIDHYLHDEERSQREFNPEKILAQVREKCTEGIRKAGVESLQVFLVSSVDIHLYDFPLLRETFDKDFHAREQSNIAVLLATSHISQQINNEKKAAFMAKIKYCSVLSAVVAAVPLPGLSVAVDTAMMVGVVKGYIDGFGLDKKSLQRLADVMGVSLHVIKEETKSPLIAVEITTDLLVKALLQCARIVAILEAAEEGVRFIPIFGSLASASLSLLITQLGLSSILNMLAEDAHSVFFKALLYYI